MRACRHLCMYTSTCTCCMQSMLGCRRERMHRAASARLLRRGLTCPPSPPMCRETAHTHACERMQTCIQLCTRRHVHVCARSRTRGRAVRLRRRAFGVAERMRHCLAVAHLRPARLSRYTAHSRHRQGHHGSRVVTYARYRHHEGPDADGEARHQNMVAQRHHLCVCVRARVSVCVFVFVFVFVFVLSARASIDESGRRSIEACFVGTSAGPSVHELNKFHVV